MDDDPRIEPLPPQAQAEVDRIWHDHWAPTLTHDGEISIELVKRELFDYAVVLDQVTQVYDTLTMGRFSKPNTAAEYVISSIEEQMEKMFQEKLEEQHDEQARQALMGLFAMYVHEAWGRVIRQVLSLSPPGKNNRRILPGEVAKTWAEQAQFPLPELPVKEQQRALKEAEQLMAIYDEWRGVDPTGEKATSKPA